MPKSGSQAPHDDVKRNRTVNTIPGQYTRGYVYDAFGEVVKAKKSYKSGQTKAYYYTYDDGGNVTDEFKSGTIRPPRYLW